MSSTSKQSISSDSDTKSSFPPKTVDPIDASYHLSDKNLTSLIEEENNYEIVVSIREEIMESVFDKINVKYVEEQTLKLMNDCTLNALEKVIELCFYVRDQGQPYYDHHPEWHPGTPAEPSIPDSWANHNDLERINNEESDVDFSEYSNVEPMQKLDLISFRGKSGHGNAKFSLNPNEASSRGNLRSIAGTRKHTSLVNVFSKIKVGPKLNLPPVFRHDNKFKKKPLYGQRSNKSGPTIGGKNMGKPCRVGRGVILPQIRIEAGFEEATTMTEKMKQKKSKGKNNNNKQEKI